MTIFPSEPITEAIKESADIITVSRDIAKCPECGNSLIVIIQDFDRETGLGLAEAITVQCINEDLEDIHTWHRSWQREWRPVIDKVRDWLIESNLAV